MSADSQTEIQAEQAVVDHAYRRLEAMRAEARALASDVLDQGAGGTFANRIERDVRMEVTGRRRPPLHRTARGRRRGERTAGRRLAGAGG